MSTSAAAGDDADDDRARSEPARAGLGAGLGAVFALLLACGGSLTAVEAAADALRFAGSRATDDTTVVASRDDRRIVHRRFAARARVGFVLLVLRGLACSWLRRPHTTCTGVHCYALCACCPFSNADISAQIQHFAEPENPRISVPEGLQMI